MSRTARRQTMVNSPRRNHQTSGVLKPDMFPSKHHRSKRHTPSKLPKSNYRDNNISRVSMLKEQAISETVPMRRDYAFLRKGNSYKTLHVRKLTHAAKQDLYIIFDQNRQQIGLRAPKAIISKVHAQAAKTLSKRRDAVAKRDAASNEKAAACMRSVFPAMPEEERKAALKQGFKKHSKRVGRVGTMALRRKVVLAVTAHVRHKWTGYEEMLRSGTKKDDARKEVWRQVQDLMRKWGYEKGEKG